MAEGTSLTEQPRVGELDETIVDVLELIFGKLRALGTKRQATQAQGEVNIQAAAKPEEVDRFLKPSGPQVQGWVEAMFGAHARYAYQNKQDVDEVIRSKMAAKNPFMVMLGDTLTGLANPQAETVREKLFRQEMQKRTLRNQRMTAISNTLRSLGMTDAQNQQTAVTKSGQVARARAQQQQARIDDDASERDLIETLMGDVVGSKLDLSTQLQAEREKSERNFEEAKKLAKYQKELELEQRKKEKELGLAYRSSGSSDVSKPSWWKIGTRPDGLDIVGLFSWNADTGKIEALNDPRFPNSVKETPDSRKNRFNLNNISRNIKRTGELYNAELLENPNSKGLPTKLALQGMMKGLFGVANLFDVTMPEFLSGYELSGQSAEFLRSHFDQVLAKVKELSGQQVTNEEREYVKTTLPGLLEHANTYGIGLQVTRLWTGWRLGLASESVTDTNGLTKLTQMDPDSRDITNRDYTSEVIDLQHIAELLDAKEGARLGDGARWLATVDETKPWLWQKRIDEYYAPALAVYHEGREGN